MKKNCGEDVFCTAFFDIVGPVMIGPSRSLEAVRAIPKSLRETSEGGLAVTETAKHLAKRLQELG